MAAAVSAERFNGWKPKFSLPLARDLAFLAPVRIHSQYLDPQLAEWKEQRFWQEFRRNPYFKDQALSRLISSPEEFVRDVLRTVKVNAKNGYASNWNRWKERMFRENAPLIFGEDWDNYRETIGSNGRRPRGDSGSCLKYVSQIDFNRDRRN